MEKIINLLPSSFHKEIITVVENINFPWHYSASTSREIVEGSKNNSIYIDENTIDSNQFVHMAFDGELGPSHFFTLFRPILYFLEDKSNITISSLLRIKINLLLQNSIYPENCYNIPHYDLDESNYKSFIYYINDSDGDTVIFDQNSSEIKNHLTVKELVQPISNLGILFNSNIYHASCPPRNYEKRIVANFVFKT
jgi:hypothetical protein